MILVILLLIGCIRAPEPSITGAIVAVPVENGEVIEPEPVEKPINEPKKVVVTPTTEVVPEEPIPNEIGLYQVNITRDSISPHEITIPRGSTIVWTNYDRVPRQILSKDFETPILRAGQNFRYKFEDVGMYSYSEGHELWGTINVIEAADGYVRLVKITAFAYEPQNVTIKKGETVRWKNTESTSHTVSGAGFNSGSLRKDETFEHTFDTLGTYPYGDVYQDHLTGTVIVKS